MAFQNNPGIVKDSLVMYYDVNNPKSFTGSPTVNQISLTDSYPTTGNGWGTYNVNHYNGGAYFSIGGIASVTGNLVTTTGTHGLITYDVLTPQTTGGGVTAGTHYIVKAWSPTTFALYTYSSTQDGSLGFSVFDNLNADTRISVNSTSFPTMWWGTPHMPNSAIVKQVIPNGFRYKGRVHDCLRVHWFRADGVKDGMAYGVYPAWIVGNNTVSFYYKASDPRGVGAVISFQVYVNGYNTSQNTNALTMDWQKFTWTNNSTQAGGCNFYWFQASGATRISWDIAEITSCQTNVVSEMVSGTRSSTQAFIDLTGQYTLTDNNMTYDSTGYPVFNGASSGSSVITTSFPASTLPTSTIEAWVYPTKGTGSYRAIVQINSNTDDALYLFNGGSQIGFWPSGAVSLTAPDNQWTYVAMVNTGSSLVYYTGNNSGFNTASGTYVADATDYAYIKIGSSSTADSEAFGGKIPIVRIYNRALTALEIKQNFSAQRGKFGV